MKKSLSSPLSRINAESLKLLRFDDMLKTVINAFLIILITLLISRCSSSGEQHAAYFSQASAIWPVGRQYEKNMTVGFRAEFTTPEKEKVKLKITGSSLYRIFLNGDFVGHGPARAAHGHYRVDEWDLSDFAIPAGNILAVEVAGYNVNSFYLLDQPSFIQAEIVSGEEILAATSPENNDFTAIPLETRIKKVPRYSFQRPFIEYYRLNPGYDAWTTAMTRPEKSLVCEEVGPKNLIPRRIGYPDFIVREPVGIIASGEVKTGIKRNDYWKDRAVLNIGEKLKGFTQDELVLNPSIELQEMEITKRNSEPKVYDESAVTELSKDQFQIFDLGTNLTGFIGAEIEVTKPGRLYLTFDEILSGGDVDFKRLGCINCVTYDLTPGRYRLESMEPYTLRYLKSIFTEGECEITRVYLREYANPDIKRAGFESSDLRLNRVFQAGIETFRQNAVDVFMDCPSRERAAWLCDSYFTARVAQDVSGNTLIEKNFYENFLLPDQFEFLPEGMLPMCYPADHNDGVFIPNWAMWFVVQLREYLYRSNDRKLVNALKPRVMVLLDYFEPFKNEDGLLEKLDSWIFVEWSEANRFVQDVNYPTNMLFAATLEAAGELYGVEELKDEASAIREVIRQQSFSDEFFVDNALRDQQGKLVVTENTSEVCQYYAFYFDIAKPDSHPELWHKLVNSFGPERSVSQAYSDVHPANSFVGNYLRLELLSRYNLQSQLLEESIGFFDYMAERTGTLWENISPYASCNHGFASHVVHVLYRDVLGIEDVNLKEKKIIINFSDIELSWCKGAIPVGEGLIKLEWNRQGDEILYQVEIPDGFEIDIQNDTGLKLVKK